MIVLVMGGTRSGKSGVAESIAESLGSAVTYVATAAVNPDDADHAARVAAHQARRPPHWSTVECVEPEDLPRFLREIDGVMVVDSLGTWVARHSDLAVEADGLLDVLARRLILRSSFPKRLGCRFTLPPSWAAVSSMCWGC